MPSIILAIFANCTTIKPKTKFILIIVALVLVTTEYIVLITISAINMLSPLGLFYMIWNLLSLGLIYLAYHNFKKLQKSSESDDTVDLAASKEVSDV